MREIKFRSWDNVNNEMLYPGEEEVIFQLCDGYIECIDLRNNDPHDEEFEMLDHLKYMQFTGLTDVNGNNIYEGDIVKATNIQGNRVAGEVYYNYGSFVIHNDYFKNLNNLSVLGNIYES